MVARTYTSDTDAFAARLVNAFDRIAALERTVHTGGGSGGGGGADEVWIGPSDPGGGFELWYDSDAPGPSADDQRWASAWGIVAAGTPIGVGVNVAAGSVVALCAAIPFTMQAGRRYRLVASLRAIQAAGGNLMFQWREGSAAGATIRPGYLSSPSGEPYFGPVAGSTYGGGTITWVVPGDGVARNYVCTVEANAASFLFNDYKGLAYYIEDVGPVAGASGSGPLPSACYAQATLVGGTDRNAAYFPMSTPGTARGVNVAADGFTVVTPGMYRVSYDLCLAGVTGGAYIVPTIQKAAAATPTTWVDSWQVPHATSNYWSGSHVSIQADLAAGDRVRPRCGTDITAGSVDSRSYFNMDLVGPRVGS
jgi:hypothetical protein